MDGPTQMTIGEALANFLSICSYISIIAAATVWIAKAIGLIQKPAKEKEKAMNDKIVACEVKIDELKDKFKDIKNVYTILVDHYHTTALRHDEQIRQLYECQVLLLEVQRASIDYKLSDGSDKASLREMDAKIDKYLSDSLRPHPFGSNEDNFEDLLNKYRVTNGQ